MTPPDAEDTPDRAADHAEDTPVRSAGRTVPPADDAEDLYEHAPCGYLSTLPDGRITKINTTLLTWLGYEREQVVGVMRFADLLSVGGKLYHETHFAPLLRLQGEVSGIALELRASDGDRLPVLVTSVVQKSGSRDPQLIRTTVFDARERRKYERELLRARKEAEADHREAESLRAEAERERTRLREALATLRQSLLPPSLPDVPGLQAAAHYQTASQDRFGGDFYDLFPLADGHWGFFLGDVCGKGVEAATVTSVTRYTLRTAARYEADPVRVLSVLNGALQERYGDSDDPRYCTVVAGVLTPGADGCRIELASGGHPPAVLLRADGTASYLDTPGGMLVGVLSTARFTPAVTLLRPGDTLLLYTDGLTEARTGGPGDERYGDEALLALAEHLAPAGAHDLVAAVARLLDGFGSGLDDDTALLALSPRAR